MIDQNKMLLEYLQANRSITALQAVQDLGITRLSARVYDLRSEGYDISMRMQAGRNRFGRAISYGVYTLEGGFDESGQLRLL